MGESKWAAVQGSGASLIQVTTVCVEEQILFLSPSDVFWSMVAVICGIDGLNKYILSV